MQFEAGDLLRSCDAPGDGVVLMKACACQSGLEILGPVDRDIGNLDFISRVKSAVVPCTVIAVVGIGLGPPCAQPMAGDLKTSGGVSGDRESGCRRFPCRRLEWRMSDRLVFTQGPGPSCDSLRLSFL